MKIIDLLNKIANGEEVPKKVKYGVYYWEYDEENKDYKDNYDDYVFNCSNYDIIDMLNKDVEIIEEPQKHKIPEKISDILRIDDLIPPVDENMYKIWEQTIKNHNKINEIIDYLEVNND